MTLVLDFRRQLEARRDELRPLVEEYEEIERHLAAIETVGADDRGHSRRRVPFRERAEQVLRLVEHDPGVRVGTVARALGVSSPRVVQIVNRLVDDGSLERQEQGGLIIASR